MSFELKNINGNGGFTLVNSSNGGEFYLIVTLPAPSPSITPTISITPTNTPTITPSLSSGTIPSSGCWQNIIMNVTTAGYIKYRIDSCGSATYGYLTTYFDLGEYTMLPCLDISTLSPDEDHSPSGIFTVVSSGTSCFVPTPTVTPTKTPSLTLTPTPTISNSLYYYEVYTIDEYCNIGSSYIAYSPTYYLTFNYYIIDGTKYFVMPATYSPGAVLLGSLTLSSCIAISQTPTISVTPSTTPVINVTPSATPTLTPTPTPTPPAMYTYIGYGGKVGANDCNDQGPTPDLYLDSTDIVTFNNNSGCLSGGMVIRDINGDPIYNTFYFVYYGSSCSTTTFKSTLGHLTVNSTQC